MSKTIAPTAVSGRSRSSADVFARGLGYFSLALGATEVLAASTLCRALGMEGRERIVQGFGVRELATGVAILASHDATPWILGRVAGDALDIATVATGLKHDNPKQNNVIAALGALIGATILDVVCAQQLLSEKGGARTAVADYGDRSGFPRPVQTMRGAAADFAVPADFRAPEALRPWRAEGVA